MCVQIIIEVVLTYYVLHNVIAADNNVPNGLHDEAGDARFFPRGFVVEDIYQAKSFKH